MSNDTPAINPTPMNFTTALGIVRRAAQDYKALRTLEDALAIVVTAESEAVRLQSTINNLQHTMEEREASTNSTIAQLEQSINTKRTELSSISNEVQNARNTADMAIESLKNAIAVEDANTKRKIQSLASEYTKAKSNYVIQHHKLESDYSTRVKTLNDAITATESKLSTLKAEFEALKLRVQTIVAA